MTEDNCSATKKKITTRYGTQRSIVDYRGHKFRNEFLFSDKQINATPSQSISLRPVFLLSFDPRIFLKSSHFPSSSLPETLKALLFNPHGWLQNESHHK